MVDWETAELYYMKGKGTGKSKKGKSSHYMDVNAAWKGKGKGYSSGSSGRPPVNAYATEAFYGLEMKGPLNLHSTSSAALKRGHALLDCGATASAGPEDFVKSLIGAIVAADIQTSVLISKYMRPFFQVWEWMLESSKLQGHHHL